VLLCWLRGWTFSFTLDGGSPLHVAVQKGQPSCVQLLLEAGAEVNSQTSYYQDTPAHVACHFDQPACMQVLLQHQARTDLKNKCNESLVQVACEKSTDCLAILQQLPPHLCDGSAPSSVAP
jgi:ankyrin repeat protein